MFWKGAKSKEQDKSKVNKLEYSIALEFLLRFNLFIVLTTEKKKIKNKIIPITPPYVNILPQKDVI